MNIDFKHYEEIELDMGNGTKVSAPFPSSFDCTFHDICKMLHMEESLRDYINENDTISTFRDESEYNGNIVVLYHRVQDEEPRALFCFDKDNRPKVNVLHAAIIRGFKDAFAEEMI